jgi:hypothetical protein
MTEQIKERINNIRKRINIINLMKMILPRIKN